MRILLVLLAMLSFSHLLCQKTPVTISADLYPTLRFVEGQEARFLLYDDSGQFSRLRLGVGLENGWFLRVFQKFGRVDGEVDKTTIEEGFIENPGSWAVGKVYLPFGSGRVIRENGYGGRLEFDIEFLNLPVQIGYVGNPSGATQGGTIRVGESAGISVAFGEFFGISSTSLTQIRFPEDSPGLGRGYRLLYGADGKLQFGDWTFGGELVFCRDGHESLDADEDLLNGYLTYQSPTGPLLLLETTFLLKENKSFYKASAEIPFSKKLFVVPTIRKYDDLGWAYSITIKVRL